MIPDRQFLERFYDKPTVERLWKLRLVSERLPRIQANDMVRAYLRTLWDNEPDYIQNTHQITTKKDGVVLLRWNKPQKRWYEAVVEASRAQRRAIRNIITKARQMGFSTVIESWIAEQLDRLGYRNAMVVNFDDANTAELFQKTDFWLSNNYCPRETKRWSGGVIEFSKPHGSTFHTRSAGSFEVGRSLTIHYAHASEIPIWPDPDSTFVALNNAMVIGEDTAIFEEATARGAQGHHYETWSMAEDGQNDYIPFFAPWFWMDEYSMEFASEDHRRRYANTAKPSDVAYRERYGLSWEQMQWRAWMTMNKCNGSARKFQEEYPACANDAFMTTGYSVFDAETVLKLEMESTPPLWVGDAILTPPS